MWPVLTRDNLHLSRPTMAVLKPTGKVTLNCTNPPKADKIDSVDGLPERVSGYVRDSLSGNTRRAYRSDLTHFQEWGGTIPATDELIAAYLADHAGELSVSTLMRRLASIAKAHAAQGLGNPTRSILVQSTMRGIKRAHTMLQRQAKPLLVNGMTLHGLRHWYASAAAEMNFSELTIAGLLGHSVRGVTARYATTPDSALKAAANEVSEKLAECLCHFSVSSWSVAGSTSPC